MNFILQLVFVFANLYGMINGFKLECIYRFESTECKVNFLKITERDVEVTSISVNSEGQRNLNVKEIWIDRGVESEFAPAGLCKFFTNTERVDIYGANIKHISRKAFTGCVKVSKVCLLFTSLMYLPDDLFYDLVELKELFLYENKLSILPENLVAKNLKLTTFSARKNQLFLIDTVFSSSLNSVDLRENKCINKAFPADINSLAPFIDEINRNCESPCKKEIKEKVEIEEELRKNLTKKNSELESLNDERNLLLKNVLELNSTISRLNQENEILLKENAERENEVKAITSNNTKVIAEMFDENIFLKRNFSKIVNEKSKENDELKSFSSGLRINLANVQEEALDLRSNLTIADATLRQIQEKVKTLLIENVNFNNSLEKCREELTKNNETIYDLENDIAFKTTNITESTSEELKLHDSLLEITAEYANLKKKYQQIKLHWIYFIVLAIASVVIFTASMIYTRRQSGRLLIKTMVNHEVSMRRLTLNEALEANN